MRGGGFAANLPHLKEMQLSKDAKYHFFSLNKAVEVSRNVLKGNKVQPLKITVCLKYTGLFFLLLSYINRT